MSASKTGADKRDLIKGAVNLNLGNGYAVRLTEDGEMLVRIPYGGIDYEPIEVSVSTFLRAVGFTIDNPQNEYLYFGIVVGLFNFIGHIKFNHFRSIIKSIDAAVQDIGSIGLY